MSDINFIMRLLRKLTKKEWKEIGEKYKDGGVIIIEEREPYFITERNFMMEEIEGILSMIGMRGYRGKSSLYYQECKSFQRILSLNVAMSR